MGKSLAKYIAVSLLLHVAVGAMFMVSVAFGPRPQPVRPIETDAIEAVAVDQSQIDAEVERLKELEAAEREAERQRQQAAEEQARQAREAREREEARLQELQRQREAEEQRQREAKEQAAALERKRQQEAERLKQLEAERQAAEEKARREEEARLERERQAKLEAERKAREEAERKQREEEEKKRRAEEERQRKLEEERRKQAELERQRAAEQAAREKALREQMAKEEFNRKLAQAANTFQSAVTRAVTRTWTRPPGSQVGLSTKMVIQLSIDGTVQSVRTVQSSGNGAFDRSAELAIRKASPLPMPKDPEVAREFAKQGITFTFRPDR